MTNQFDMAAIINQAAQQSPNMNEAQKGGGGEYTPPKAGNCIVTLIGYIEKGIQHVPASKHDPVKFPAKDEDQVDLIFELSGKGHEPKEHEGKLYPERMTVTLKKSLNEKAWFYKIFKALNYDGQATHFAQLLGQHFLATVVHSEPNKEGKVFASFKDKSSGYTFRAPFYNPDPMDLSVTAKFPKPEVISEQRLFLWDFASKQMWDSLYIDGEYPERKDEKSGKIISPARSKNVIQNKIKGAVNFKGSPIAEIIGDDALNLDEAQLAGLEQSQAPAESKPEPQSQTSQQAADDALAGLLG